MSENEVNLEEALAKLTVKMWERGFMWGFVSGVLGVLILLAITTLFHL